MDSHAAISRIEKFPAAGQPMRQDQEQRQEGAGGGRRGRRWSQQPTPLRSVAGQGQRHWRQQHQRVERLVTTAGDRKKKPSFLTIDIDSVRIQL